MQVTMCSSCRLPGCSSDSDRLSLAELDDGMASRQDSPGPRHLAELPALGAMASVSELGRVEEERVPRSRFPGSLRSRLGRRDYLEKAGELIQLALKKEEEDDYAAASRFYRKAVDLLLEGVQGMVVTVVSLGMSLCGFKGRKFIPVTLFLFLYLGLTPLVLSNHP